MRSSLTKHVRGFTLIEALVSILLLSLVLAGGMSVFFRSDEFTIQVMHKRLALEMANTKLEDLRRIGYDNLPAVGTPEVATLTVGDQTMTQTVNVSKVAKTYDPSCTVDPTDSLSCIYRKVDLTINWTDTEKLTPKYINMSTYIAP